MRFSSFAIALTFSVLGAAGVEAQAPTQALPFHAGQWAGQFAIGSNVNSVGVLRFHSPSAAWLFNANASVSHGTTNLGFGSSQEVSAQGLSLQLGPRSYAPVSAQIVRYLGAGLLGAVGHTTADDANLGTSSSSKTWAIGGYGELGGDYMLTSHLGIGVQGTVQATYGRASITSGAQSTTGNSWFLGLGSTRLVATIFF